MKLMRLAVCAAVFALMGGIVLGEDVAALQAKLAAQEARLNDLQAKMNNVGVVGSSAAPEAITSLRKNATVQVGGYFSTRYYFGQGELTSDVAAAGYKGKGTIANTSLGDTALEFKIDVNEYFDAYIELNFNDSDRGATGPAKNYWMRWKNLCNTGFGVLVGRDNIAFGGVQSYGFFDSFGNNTDDSLAQGAFVGWDALGLAALGADAVAGHGDGMFWGDDTVAPAHMYWNDSRTIQVTPYWESQDGKIKAELSWFQMTENDNNRLENFRANRDSVRSINHGFGSFSGRLTWKPIEGLLLSGSVMNLHARNDSLDSKFSRPGRAPGDMPLGLNANFQTSNNNFGTNLAFEYRPCFFNRLNVFASWNHGWNDNWVKDMDSDSINYGLGFDINESLTAYATGDYLRVSNKNSDSWNKATGWAVETGLMYTLPYGVEFKAAWRHDALKFKERNGDTRAKYKADTFVVHAGFSF